ncbi:cell wall hydrolase [Herbiconiux daphne]|uniref:Cell wall hydrolase n=1 Tax=Herbiconiux daphne TaxID=2970914 RepID=A0ABT2H9E1_9MICO|nr:cell wall hydrolase [Herbiconiux daphne]MCS5736560.1 cell wall hydrolase [Herbiconiux daphne]
MPVSVDTLYTAVTVYKEARGEPRQCQVLVAEVVRNRMDNKGKSAQQIVKERGQFSWMPLIKGQSISSVYNRIQSKAKNGDQEAIATATSIANQVLQPGYDTGNNLYYFHSIKGRRHDVKCGNLYFSYNRH